MSAVVVASLAAAWGLYCWWTFAPDLGNRLRDDAYYEFVWAINFAEGRCGTVSDGVTTSGVQWLWTLLLAGIAWLFGSQAVLLAPFLGGALHVVNAAIWWRLPRDRATGVVLALCWLGHPLLLREAQNGQETALAVLCATGVYALRHGRERSFVPMCILATLARSDLFALVFVMSLCRHRRAPFCALPAPVLSFAALAALNLHFGGGLLQDSGMPMSWLWHQNLEQVAGFWSSQWWFTRPVLLGGPFALASTFGFGLVAFLLIRPWWPAALRVVPAVAVGAAASLGVHDLATAGWCALLLALFPAVKLRPMPCWLLAVTVGLVAIVVLHWAIRWYPRDYYLAPLVVAAFAAMQRLGRWRLLLLAFPIVQLQDSWRVQPEPLGGQAEMRLAGQLLERTLPASERVGCFNSGIVTWFDAFPDPVHRDRPRGIVNLDGVVDRRSFAALQAHRLGAWLDEQGVRFVLDSPHQFSLDPAVPHACGRFFGDGFDPDVDLVEVARFDVAGVHGALPSSDSMRLYWRRGRGAPPARWIEPGTLRSLGPEEASPRLVLWGAQAGASLLARWPGGERLLARVDVDTAVVLELPSSLPDGASLHIERR
ncbi:MAG: hypothetical protein ACE37K_00400 [Planctomycetota bacterium]